MLQAKDRIMIPHWRYEVLQRYIIDEQLKRVCEVGIEKGTTAKKVLKSLAGRVVEEYWGIDPYFPPYDGPSTVGMERGLPSKYHWMCYFMVRFKQFRIVKLPSTEAIRLFTDGYFDLVFIDAYHSREAVREDIECWRDKVRKGGILCGHDYFLPSEDRPLGRGRYPGVKLAVDEVIGIDNIWFASDVMWMTRI